MSNTVRRHLLIRVIPLSLLVVVMTAVAGWLAVRTLSWGVARLDRVLTAPPTDERIAAHLRAHRELERPHGKRGDRFFEATYLIADERCNQMTGAEVVELLGPPDLTKAAADGGKTYAYFWDRYASKDWVILMACDSAGTLREVSYGGAPPSRPVKACSPCIARR